MCVLLRISDTHFGTEQPQVVEALVALAAQQRPAVVVLSGNITQRARPAQFRAAKLFVDRLGAPVRTIPGNHHIALFDLWARLTRPYARYAKMFGADLEPVHSSPDLLVVGVNTTPAVSRRTRPEVPNSVNILRWRETSGARGDQTQIGSEAGKCCLIEQWDFARHDRVFVRTAVKPAQPERG